MAPRAILKGFSLGNDTPGKTAKHTQDVNAAFENDKLTNDEATEVPFLEGNYTRGPSSVSIIDLPYEEAFRQTLTELG
jgi:hypothetical protein